MRAALLLLSALLACTGLAWAQGAFGQAHVGVQADEVAYFGRAPLICADGFAK